MTALTRPVPSSAPYKHVPPAFDKPKLPNVGVSMTERETQTAAIDADQQLRARLADYEARLDEVAELVARVRHEINNPLTGVLGQAQLLLREELNDKARKRAEAIEDLAIRLRDIVAQLREVQRPANNSPQSMGTSAE